LPLSRLVLQEFLTDAGAAVDRVRTQALSSLVSQRLALAGLVIQGHQAGGAVALVSPSGQDMYPGEQGRAVEGGLGPRQPQRRGRVGRWQRRRVGAPGNGAAAAAPWELPTAVATAPPTAQAGPGRSDGRPRRVPLLLLRLRGGPRG